MEQDIIALQELCTHQSREICELSDEIFTQQKQIMALERKVELLIDHVKKQQMSDGNGMRDTSHEMPPPHY